MSPLLQWKESYSVKVAALDNHHKKLFQLVNELNQAMGETPELMTFLQQWLRNHIQTVDQRYRDFLNAQGVH